MITTRKKTESDDLKWRNVRVALESGILYLQNESGGLLVQSPIYMYDLLTVNLIAFMTCKAPSSIMWEVQQSVILCNVDASL